jgi:hypothetical protein
MCLYTEEKIKQKILKYSVKYSKDTPCHHCYLSCISLIPFTEELNQLKAGCEEHKTNTEFSHLSTLHGWFEADRYNRGRTPTRQAKYVWRNIGARSRKNCCRGKAASVAVVIQHISACAVLYCHPWPLWLYLVFKPYLINKTIFEKSFWT